MKTPFLFIFLLAFLTSCKKNVEPQAPDAATIIAGTYKVTRAVLYWGEPRTNYGASLKINRINANTVKTDFLFDHASPFTETWTLEKVAEDTVKIKSGSFYVSQYQKGQIDAMLADRILNLRFEQMK